MPQPLPAPVKLYNLDQLAVRIYGSHDELAAAAAGEAAAFLTEALRKKPEVRVILASAASQVKFLAALLAERGLDWSRITLFHMDEYLGITDQHPASFRRFLRERVASQIPIRTFHYLEGEALEPIKECERYARLLAEQPIDLCCLGIGENGHVAFNDPPVANFRDARLVKLVRLDEPCRRQQVGEGAFPTLEAVPQYAFSLTIPALCAASRLLAIVPEKRKANAVKAALQGPIHTACPASILRTQAHATLFLDTDSASLL